MSRTIDSWLFFCERWIRQRFFRSAPIIRCTAVIESSFERWPKRDMIRRLSDHG